MDLGFTISGPDARALFAALARHPSYAARAPDRLRVDGKERKANANWSTAVAETRGRLVAEWGELGGQLLTYRPSETLSGRILGIAADAATVMELLVPLPFELAVFVAIDDAWWPSYTPPGFGDLHALHGWGCAFRGAGHDRLVSRRWLEHGPWRLARGPEDLSLVQFHDFAADEATALAQAKVGHARMGISRQGGFLQEPFVFAHDIQGLYVAEEKKLVISAADRDVSESEMLDACAARRLRRNDPEAPIERIAYLWTDEAVARRHVDALWLRELECWALVDGRRVRLDGAEGPAPNPPAWAR